MWHIKRIEIEKIYSKRILIYFWLTAHQIMYESVNFAFAHLFKFNSILLLAASYLALYFNRNGQKEKKKKTNFI